MRAALCLAVGILVATPAAVAQNVDRDKRILEREKRYQKYLLDHSDRRGNPRPDLLRKGTEYVKKMKTAAGIRPVWGGRGKGVSVMSPDGGLIGIQWTGVGPAGMAVDSAQSVMGSGPTSGEVVDIAIDPRNTSDQVIYIATNDGGIWKTTNGGTTWNATMDFMPSLSMGAVALDPNNPSIVYAGTGDPFDGSGRYCCNGSPNLKAVGVYKSTDAGATWTQSNPITFSQPTGIFTGQSINRIVVLPSNSNVVLLATGNGLFRSVDGGQNFGSNSPLYDDGQPLLGAGTFISDLKIDTGNSSTVLAAVSGVGILRSTDGGATFPTNLFLDNNNNAKPNTPPTGQFVNVTFAQSTVSGGVNNNQTILALVASTTNQSATNGNKKLDGLYKSTDNGGTWTKVLPFDWTYCQCPYDQTVGVDPQDPSHVYVGFVDMFRATDGGVNGASFSIIGDNDIHDDHHAVTFSPRPHWSGTPTPIYVGTDGGISRSSSAGDNGSWTNIDAGIATHLFFTMDMGRGSTANNGYMYGALQDQGVPDHRPAMAATEWHLNTGGDGFAIGTDPANGARAYGRFNSTTILTTDGGMSWSGMTINGLPSGASTGDLTVDPNNGNTLYTFVGKQLFRASVSGTTATFTSIATFTANIQGQTTATVKIDSNTVWVGLADGTVQSTSNALAATPTWTSHTIPGAPGFGVAGIAIDPTNTATVVVVYPGFSDLSSANSTLHVFLTTDNGTNWTDITGHPGGTENLPDLPLNSVVIDPGTSPHTIIVASDVSVMRTPDLGQTWQVYGVGFPTVLATALALDTAVTPSLLRVSTYGRSVFELTSATGPLLAVNANLAFGTVCLGSSATAVVQIFNVGSSDLHISSFTRVSGSPDFKIISGPPTPVTVPPGEEIDYTIQFTPTASGPESAVFQIDSDDPFQPVKQLQASGTGGTGTLQLTGSAAFGNVCAGTPAQQTISLCNVGACDVHVTAIDTGCADFTLVNPPTLPLTLSHDSCVNLTLAFTPQSGGSKTCVLTVTSDSGGVPGSIATLPETANTPMPSIDVPPDFSFPPTVIQSIAACHTQKPFPISNTGTCNLKITGITVGGADGGDYALSGLPSFPIILQPGHTVGDGDLEAVFSPTVLDRDRFGTITVTYESDPITHATASITRNICGEGVYTGARVLVTAGGVPLETVEKIQLQRLNGNRNKNLLDTVDVAKDLTLQTVTPGPPCTSFQYHREYGTVSNPIQLAPGSYQLTVTAIVNGKRQTMTVGFDTNSCTFNATIVVSF